MHGLRSLKTAKLVSGIILLIGVLLAAMMIQAESEPGALPLALILLGGIGYTAAWLKSRGIAGDNGGMPQDRQPR